MFDVRFHKAMPALLAWFTLCSGGVWLLAEHASTAGVAHAAPAHLPPQLADALRWNREQPLLVVHAHPQCPCLPSTLAELRRVTTNAKDTTLRVLCLTPTAPGPDWDPRATEELASRFGAQALVYDRDGEISAALGAATSGHVHAYDAAGRLRFSGGVTAARAHVGDNASGRALRAALSAATPTAIQTEVFGCPLLAAPCCKP